MRLNSLAAHFIFPIQPFRIPIRSPARRVDYSFFHLSIDMRMNILSRRRSGSRNRITFGELECRRDVSAFQMQIYLLIFPLHRSNVHILLDFRFIKFHHAPIAEP